MQATLQASTSGRTAVPRGRVGRLDISARFALPTLFADKKTQRAEVKSKLLEAVKPLQRGVLATEEDRAAVESLAQELERLTPTPKPLASPLINGKWLLLYTTSQTVLGLNKPALFRPSGPIYQVIDAASLRARNIESAPFFNQVSANLEPLSANKVAVQFDEFRIFNLIAVKAPPTARGELAITYLDEDLRLSRGDKGNLFILAMQDRGFKP